MLMLPKGVDKIKANVFSVLYWNYVGLQMNRITHSLGGPQGGPTMSSRALGLLHLAMHDAFFGVLGKTEATTNPRTYLPDAIRPSSAGLPSDLASANAALTGAAITVLDELYGDGGKGISILASDTLARSMGKMIGDYDHHIDATGAAHVFGAKVAKVILQRLAVKPGDIGADAGRYEPKQGPFKFRDEPLHPVRRQAIDPNDRAKGTRPQRVYHGPFYGVTVPSFAVTDDDVHTVADWPEADYDKALEEVVRLGGAAQLKSTERSADGTISGLFWAYDGANLIGTPPRLYNQILREIAWAQLGAPDPMDLAQNSDLVRLFALANVAMADAGKFCWKEKYKHELWRPLTGVRENHTRSSPDNIVMDPFWSALGAPDTNSNRVAFKPPFPAYPSGHATFGAACFQMARLFYRSKETTPSFNVLEPDTIAFTFVSEELDGVSRDLYEAHDPAEPIEDQPGNVRTYVPLTFPSLWAAIFHNAFSRIYLGVHWRFDAADAGDFKASEGIDNKDPVDIRYSHVWPRSDGEELPIGGVPLGLGIANDIFDSGMIAPAAVVSSKSTTDEAKKSLTIYR